MVNNVNPSASKLLEQIKRLSVHTTQKEINHLDFSKDVLNNRTDNILKGKNLSNSGRVQGKNEMSNHLAEEIKREPTGKNIQIPERSKPSSTGTNLRRKPVGSFLDIYL
ncbi:MAG: hypothetical protein ACK41Q_12030 [Candidatus Brocadia sp.]